jgi:hypothetical protein
MPGPSKWLLTSDFPSKTLYTPLLALIRATCPAHLIILDLINRIIFGEYYRSLRSSFCSFLHSPCYLVPVRPKYSPQHPILIEPQPSPSMWALGVLKCNLSLHLTQRFEVHPLPALYVSKNRIWPCRVLLNNDTVGWQANFLCGIWISAHPNAQNCYQHFYVTKCLKQLFKIFTPLKNCTSGYMYLISYLLSFSSRELTVVSLSIKYGIQGSQNTT